MQIAFYLRKLRVCFCVSVTIYLKRCKSCRRQWANFTSEKLICDFVRRALDKPQLILFTYLETDKIRPRGCFRTAALKTEIVVVGLTSYHITFMVIW